MRSTSTSHCQSCHWRSCKLCAVVCVMSSHYCVRQALTGKRLAPSRQCSSTQVTPSAVQATQLHASRPICRPGNEAPRKSPHLPSRQRSSTHVAASTLPRGSCNSHPCCCDAEADGHRCAPLPPVTINHAIGDLVSYVLLFVS